MRKILITSSEKIIHQIEKKLRHVFEIDFEYSDSSEGKIEAKNKGSIDMYFVEGKI